MLGINLKHSLATAAVAAGLLAAAGPASAAHGIVYNGHAGLGASGYQHNQTELDAVASSSEGFWLGSNDALQAITDGTSNTISFRAR
jgi:hypothetical protein